MSLQKKLLLKDLSMFKIQDMVKKNKSFLLFMFLVLLTLNLQCSKSIDTASAKDPCNPYCYVNKVTVEAMKGGLELTRNLTPAFYGTNGGYNQVKYLISSTGDPADTTHAPITNDIEMYEIRYEVTYPSTSSGVIKADNIASIDKDKTYIQSARVFVPLKKNASDSFPIIMKMHGTIFNKADAPTSCKTYTQGCEGMMDAMNGFVVVMPDYLGFGSSADSVDIHPFFIPEYYALDAQAALGATRNLLADLVNANKTVVDPKLFVMGYSEGGYAALAVQRHFEDLAYRGGDAKYKLTASAPGAAASNLDLTAQRIFGRDYYAAPPFVANVYFAYKRSYNFTFPDTDVFQTGTNSQGANMNFGTATYNAISHKTFSLTQLNGILSDPSKWVDTILHSSTLGRGGVFVPMSSFVHDNLRKLWVNTNAAGNPTNYSNYKVYTERISTNADSLYLMRQKLQDNSLTTDKWGAVGVQTKTRLYGCSVDTIIPSVTPVYAGDIISEFGTDIASLAPTLTLGKAIPEGLTISGLADRIGETSGVGVVTPKSNMNSLTGSNVIPMTFLDVINDTSGSGALLPNSYPPDTSKDTLVTSKNSSLYSLYSNHGTCPLISAAIPWFKTFK